MSFLSFIFRLDENRHCNSATGIVSAYEPQIELRGLEGV
jgi:hypothetical protein